MPEVVQLPSQQSDNHQHTTRLECFPVYQVLDNQFLDDQIILSGFNNHIRNYVLEMRRTVSYCITMLMLNSSTIIILCGWDVRYTRQ